ncbi:LADA_0F04368g1_1 [Lachancea dasiensis]|uniref:LADA_0F04368g1_1 n=1 Tax=Lachancea dasiensis TaxID=1072105 RepID=A0A1G4JJ31_9SACH|nr:LADA_0F04368g1_1 [Lachancea dasiensis]
MGSLSSQAAQSILWPTYLLVLLAACGVAYRNRDSLTFLSANRTQKAVPLAFNFVGSSLGVGILSTFPKVANVDGLHGLMVYALASGLPMFLFAFFGPQIRQQVPNGFVLTEWVFQRYGQYCGFYLSACTILTLFLFTVSEIASLKYCIETLTSVNALPLIIAECVVTTIYTTIGGFKISFLTDTLQVGIIFVLVAIVAAATGKYVEIDTSMIESSELLRPNKLGYQLIYILAVAVFTNDFFMSGFWLRTFAAKNDRELLVGCSIAFFIITSILVLIGFTGIISVWAGLVKVRDVNLSDSCLFVLLTQLPSWIVGIVLVFVAVLSTCTLDSLQSALVSSISNDLFGNKLSSFQVRALVTIIMVPVIVVGLKATDILSIYLIVDLLSSSVIPVLLLGFSSRFDFMTSWEVIGGGLGGLFAVWVFGAVYYNSASEGAKLLLISNGLYNEDWGAFGAFVAAPFGGLAIGFTIFALRYTLCHIQGTEIRAYHPVSHYDLLPESEDLNGNALKPASTNCTVTIAERASDTLS